jgi:hypothetical protein
MKKFALLVIVAVLTALATLGSAPLGKTASEVILDASQVTSARDIEQAIDTATAYGTRPGIVTLDGSKGKFEYTGDDRSINIYYSNITLRSFNWATIGNCDDGVFFDNLPTNNILIEGVELVCLNGHAVSASYPNQPKHVILRNNYLESGPNPAVNLYRGVDWVISGNRILSLGTGIFLNESRGVMIRKNIIRANVGLELLNAGCENVLTNNQITAFQRGVVLSGKTLSNRITNNKFDHVQDAGIVFANIVTGNKVTGNKIACWPGVKCSAVTADPFNYKQNTIAGNKLIKEKEDTIH